MYETARIRTHIITSVVFIAIAVITSFGFGPVVNAANGYTFAGVIYALVLLVAGYMLMHFLVRHLEDLSVALMVRHGKIALARIEDVQLLPNRRDIILGQHTPREFHLHIFINEEVFFKQVIIEDVVGASPAKGTFVFVTYDSTQRNPGKSIGIVPTIVMCYTPSLEPVVRQLENRIHPRYVEVTRTIQGLAFKPFGKKS